MLSLQDKTGYWITTRSFPYRGPYWPGPIWASTSSQANMGVSFLDVGSYVINSLIHGHFHIGLVIIPRPIWGSRDDYQANMEMPMY